MLHPARAQCPYCGVGCGLELKPAVATVAAAPGGQDPWTVRGDRQHPSSLGQVCVKGATVGETLHHNRLTTPLFRERIDQPLQPIGWEEALSRIVAQIQQVLAERGPAGVAMYGSGQFLTEDYYLAQKLFKGALGSNNFDANSRLCMSSAVSGYARSLGSDGPPCCYDDFDSCDTVMLIGTNTADCHPVLFQRLLKRKRKEKAALQLIVIDPRHTATADAADLHLAIQPGTDLVLLHGIGHLLLRRGQFDAAFIAAFTEGYAELAALLEGWTPERVCALCGIEEQHLQMLAALWGRSRALLSLWSMGVNQSVEGTATVSGIINLHLLTGQIGRPGAGPFSLTGQPNAMGGREAGGLAPLLPGYRFVADAAHRAELERHWGLAAGAIAARPGLDVWGQIEAMERGELGLWWVAATNPLVSLPSLDRVRAAVARCPLVVLSEAYAGSETEAVAHLVLPAAQWSEKAGVMTNSERRVTLCAAFRPAPGQARADWAVFAEIGRRLGHPQAFSYGSSAEVYAEFAAITAGRICDHSGLSHRLLAEHGPQQWPFPAGTAPGGGQPRLHTEGRFPTASGRARLIAEQPLGLGEPPDATYPLVLTVGRYLGHWHTMTRTAHVQRVRRQHPEPLLEVNPGDASRYGLANGAWALVSSRRGRLTAKVLVTDRIRPGTVFLPMHWGAAQADACEANRLMHALACPISRQPELKAAAVNLAPAQA
ncbi:MULTISPECIES: molybdopterin oxidoreductase family protein [unclassified Synechococcus]|uniref:molybdopterin oxidoreductase family protein n=1 Tax=unclassified Synechococcus TaxID=2626047 RepID=UPI0021A4AED3|nr:MULTISPECIES: nitrate reductase [unclassified Synechococcus]MCT0214535.1 nitrate reductase [Synechococcus sp. CS-1326]MCT0234395.1 nitrate reductase [Synechococcus sp. CS-1327]